VSELAAKKADYGNWVSTRLVFAPGVLSLLFGGLSFVLPALGVVAVLSFLCFLYFAYARYLFSPRGGNIQARIQDLVLDRIMGWDGVGTGIDYWGGTWEYSKGVCKMNAEIEGVAGRVTFERASASSLPFDDEAFHMVVSNLVFHEVRDVRDKKKLIKEALRAVTKGGWFVFQDLFLWKRVYGEVDDLLETIRSWGIETAEFVDTSDSDFIPKALKLPFMLGTVGILYGRK